MKNSYGVGVGDGFAAGLLADGAGGGGDSGKTLFVGSGNAGDFLLLLPLLFEFSLAFAFAAGLTSSSGSGETASFAFGLAFTFAGAVILPPVGIPCSPFPLGGGDGCTGWLFGSAASVSCC